MPSNKCFQNECKFAFHRKENYDRSIKNILQRFAPPKIVSVVQIGNRFMNNETQLI